MIQLVAICGKAGAGKDAVANEVIAQAPELFKRKVSYTTRKKRPFEVEGTDYYFVSDKTFFNLLADGHIIEATDINGDMYGTGKNKLCTHKVNVGIFDPDGLEILVHMQDEIDMLIVYLEVSESVRWIRMLKEKRDTTIDEMYERHLSDKKAFDGRGTYKGTVTLQNDDNTDINTIAEVIVAIAKKYFEI